MSPAEHPVANAAAVRSRLGDKLIGNLPKSSPFVGGQFGSFVDDRITDGRHEPQVSNLLLGQMFLCIAHQRVQSLAVRAIRGSEVLLNVS